MCLAIPGKVTLIETGTQPLMGVVNFGGVEKKICFELVPEVQVGEYVIVHVGFALSKMDEQEAQETLALIEELEQGPEGPAGQDERDSSVSKEPL